MTGRGNVGGAFVPGPEMVDDGGTTKDGPDRCANTCYPALGTAPSDTTGRTTPVSSILPDGSDSKTDCPPLSWEDLCDLPIFTDHFGEKRTTVRRIYLAGVPAAVVPTRLHVPGWYIRSDGDRGPQDYWNLRREQDYVLIRRLCEAGAVTAR